MLTKEDKEFLTKSFATKDELGAVAADVTELKVESVLLQQTLQRLEQGMERIEGKTDKVLAMAEGLAGRVDTLDQENKMGSITLHRHDIQIHELATATGTTISE